MVSFLGRHRRGTVVMADDRPMQLPRLRAIPLWSSVLILGVLLFGAPAAQAAVPFSDVPVASWRVNGRVYATEVVGDTLVVGGKFSAALAPNGTKVPRVNLAAFSLTTGELLPAWRADTNAKGVVRALDSDGTDVWVGGTFTSLGGVTRVNLGRLSLATGAVSTGFAPRIPGTATTGVVRAVLVSGGSVVVGGAFASANGSSASARVVKLHAADGTTDPLFGARVDRPVWALAMPVTGDRVYLGGQFDLVNGVTHHGLAAVDAVTGELTGPAFVEPADPDVMSLDVSADGTQVFGGVTANQCLAWDSASGARQWSLGTDGNVQAVGYADGLVYCGFHDGLAGDTLTKAVAVEAGTGVMDPDWLPRIDSFLGVFAVDVTPAGLVLGGTFTTVSGVSARGFAVFRP